MNKLKYLLDGEPISAKGLIKEAKNSGYETDGFYITSLAAHFLRTRCTDPKTGKKCTVEENPDFCE